MFCPYIKSAEYTSLKILDQQNYNVQMMTEPELKENIYSKFASNWYTRISEGPRGDPGRDGAPGYGLVGLPGAPGPPGQIGENTITKMKLSHKLTSMNFYSFYIPDAF